jgi:phosphatidylserine/phosphatidylglycerophosphate/cardiolipin synthase-like enzyme
MTTRSTSKKPTKKAPKSNARLFIIGILLTGFILLGLGYTLFGLDPLGLFEEEPAPTATATLELTRPPTRTPSASGAGAAPITQADWWQVYFTDADRMGSPENAHPDNIMNKLIERINNAEESILIASFEFDLTPVAEALIAAHRRGVDVRWVTDNEHGLDADSKKGRGQFEMLDRAGIDVADDGRSALMHNKFWIFDGKTVWTGSTNITVSGIFQQNNNVIVIESRELAEIYTREFEEMWDGQFGVRSPSTLDQQNIVVNGIPIQVLFAAEDKVIDNLIPILAGAKKSIRIMAFVFTHQEMAQTIIARHKAGVDVMGIIETVGSDSQYGQMAPLMCEGIAMRRDGNPRFLHHKIIIIDEEIVITGSLNFTANATTSNDENVIVIKEPNIARLYMQEFEKLWEEATDPPPSKFPCP